MRSLASALDHLLIGARTLEEGIDWLEDRTGVRAERGGAHQGLGTWNALASLGPAQYVEIIAPDPNQGDVETFYVPGLRSFQEPRLATWAARADDVRSLSTSGLPKGLECAPPRTGGRERPDGTRLTWSLAFPKDGRHGNFDGVLPFLIEWGAGSPHPGQSAPPDLSLLSMTIRHPAKVRLTAALRALGFEGPVRKGASAAIQVELDTPRGVVLL
jgi:Glyoxalase-like domain